MLSIILNIITILILIFELTLLLRLYNNQKNTLENTSSDSKATYAGVTAPEVMKRTFVDPLDTSRSYFTASAYGKGGEFMGQQTPSAVSWIGRRHLSGP